jgi:hypothetical protein
MSDFNFDFGGLFKPEEQPPQEQKIILSHPKEKWERRAENSVFVEPQQPKAKQDYRIQKALAMPLSGREWFTTILLYFILPASICESMYFAEVQGVDWGWTTAFIGAGFCLIAYLFIQWLRTRYPSLVYGLTTRLILLAIAIVLGVISIG